MYRKKLFKILSFTADSKIIEIEEAPIFSTVSPVSSKMKKPIRCVSGYDHTNKSRQSHTKA